MPIEDVLVRYWPLIGVVLAAVIWAIRLEGRVSKVAADIRALWRQREEDQTTAASSRKEVHDALVTIQADIKDLLKAAGAKR
jgi:hypothetical protein